MKTERPVQRQWHAFAGMLPEFDALATLLEADMDWQPDAAAIRLRMLSILGSIAELYVRAGGEHFFPKFFCCPAARSAGHLDRYIAHRLACLVGDTASAVVLLEAAVKEYEDVLGMRQSDIVAATRRANSLFETLSDDDKTKVRPALDGPPAAFLLTGPSATAKCRLCLQGGDRGL